MNKKAADEKVFYDLYVPTFIKRCAEHGLNITTEEDLYEALDTTAMLRKIEGQQSSGAIKQAHDVLLKAAGVSTPAVDRPVSGDFDLPDDIKEALSAITRIEEPYPDDV